MGESSMIYDCFTFFNELDLLEIRLNILNDVVDKFVLVEMTKTHSGKDKPLYYEQNKERFQKFHHKIIHIIVDDCPESNDSWVPENYQRNCIYKGLQNCQPNDVIMISDLDEIPNPDIIKTLDCTKKIYLLEQKMYYYFINYQDVATPLWLLGTKVLSYQNFLHGLDNLDIPYSTFLIEKLNRGTTATKIRLYDGAEHIQNAGWHFSYLGGIDAIIKKIQSFSHQEYNKPEFLDAQSVQRKIELGQDIFNRMGHSYVITNIDKTFPKYILENKEKYKHLIFHPTLRYHLTKLLFKIKYFFYHKEKVAEHRKIYVCGLKVLSYKKKGRK